MTGFRTVIKEYLLDPKTGKLKKINKVIAGKPRSVLEARAKREADKWKPAEHYTPIKSKTEK